MGDGEPSEAPSVDVALTAVVVEVDDAALLPEFVALADGLPVVLTQANAVDLLAVAGALGPPPPHWSLLVPLGAGRATSVLVRELVTVDHLGGGRWRVVLDARGRTPGQLHDDLGIISAMTDHVVASYHGATASIHDAANRPGFLTEGGPVVEVLVEHLGRPRASGSRLEVLEVVAGGGTSTLLVETRSGVKRWDWCTSMRAGLDALGQRARSLGASGQ